MSEEKKGKPKLRQCAQSKKNLKRAVWYYRDGEYFANKSAYKQWAEVKKEEKEKALKEADEAKKNADAPAAV